MKNTKKILLLNFTTFLSVFAVQSHVIAAPIEEECEPDWNSHTDAKRLNTSNEWNKDWSNVTLSYTTTGVVKDRHYTASDFKATQTYYYDYKYEKREREKDECSGDVRYKPGSSWVRDTSRGDNGWKHENDPVTDINIEVEIDKDLRWGTHNDFWKPADAMSLGAQYEGYGKGTVTYEIKATGKNGETDEITDATSYWIYRVDIKLTNPRDPDNPSPLFVDDGSSNPSQPYYSDERNEDDNPSWTCTKYYGGGKGSKICSVQQENWAVGGGGSFGGRYENATSYLYSHTDHPNGHRAGQKHVLGILFFHIKDVAIIIPKKEVYADEFDPSKNKCFLIYNTVGEYQWSDGVDPTPAADYAGQIKPCTATQNTTGTQESRNNFFNNTNANKYKDYKYITYSKSHTGSRSGITKSDSGTQKIAYPRKVNVYDYRDNADSPNSKYSQTYVLYQRPKNGNEVRDAYGISCKRWWHRIKDNNGNLLGERTDSCVDKDGSSGNSQTSALGSTASPRSGTSPYLLGRMYPHNGDGNHLNDVTLGNQSHSWKYGYVDQWNWTKDEHKVNYLGVREVIVKLPSEEDNNKADEKIVERYVTDTHKNGFDRTPSTSNNHNNYLLGSSYTSYKKEPYNTPTCYVYFTSGLINAYVNQNGGSIGSGDLGFKSGDGAGDLTNGDASTRYIKRSCQNSLQTDKNYDSRDEQHSLVTGSRANNARPLYFLPSSNSFTAYNSEHRTHMNSKNNFTPGSRWSNWDLGEPYRLEDYYYMDNSYDSNASAIYIHSMVSDVKITYPTASDAKDVKFPSNYYTSVGDNRNNVEDKVWKKTYQDKIYGNYSCKYAYAPTIGKNGTASYGGGFVKVTDCLDKMFIQSDSGQNMNMDTAVNRYDKSRKISYNYVNNNYDDRYYEARIYANSTKLMYGDNHPKGNSGTVIPNSHSDEDITGSRTNYRCKVTWQDNVNWASNGTKEITYLENSLSTSDPNYKKIWYSTYLNNRFDYIGIGWKDGYVDVSGTRHKPENINQFYPVDPTGKTYYINCDYPHNKYDNNLDSKPTYVKDNYAPGKDKLKFNVLGIQKIEVFDYPSSAISNPGSGLKAVDTNGNSSDKTPFHFVSGGKGKTYETGHWYNFNAKVTFSEDSIGNQKVQWLNDSTLKEKNWRYGYQTSNNGSIPTSIDKTKLYLGNCTITYANNGSLSCPYPSHITSRTSMKFSGHDHRLPYDSGDTNRWNTFRIDYFSEAPIPTGNPEIKSKTYEEVILWSHRPIDLIIEGKSVVDYGDTENYLMKKAWSDGKSQTNHQLDDPLNETNRYVGKNNNPYLNDSEEKSETINPTAPNQAIYWETDAKLTSQNNVNPATVKFADFQGDNTKRTIYAYWGDKNRLQSGYDFWDYLYKEKVVTVNFDCSIEFKTVVEGCPIHDTLTVDGVEVDNWRFPDALQLELNYIYTMPFQVTGVAKGSGN